MTITDAITAVLSETSKPLTAAEIYDAIVARSLYKFGSMAPASVARSQLRRHCEGVDNQNSASRKLFRQIQGDRYELIDGVR